MPNINQFLGILIDNYGENIYRKIDVWRDSNGKKQPKGSYSNWTREQIADNSGSGNAYDIYIKHCVNEHGRLVCFDFDDALYQDNPLYELLYGKRAIKINSKKGCHVYASVSNLPEFSNEVNIQREYKGRAGNKKQPSTDLIVKKRNMWECYNEDHWEMELYGSEIVEVDWGEIVEFFNVEYMNKGKVKKKSPIKDMNKSPSTELIIREKEKNISRCSIKQFKSYLDRLKPHRYSYDNFVDVGIMCWVNFQGSSKGFGCWLEWVNKDTGQHDNVRDIDYLNNKWKSFNDDGEVVSDWRKLKNWADKDTPVNPYEEIYKMGGKDALIDELNSGETLGTRIGYNQMTSEFIIQTPQGWMLKNDRQAVIHFECYNFCVESEDEDESKTFMIQPFKIWRLSIKRNMWYEIVYDPSEQETGSFNLWRGYTITREVCSTYKPKDCQPILDHLMNIWADGCQERYDYILNWFAWKLQRPHKKMCVVICLNSGEGAGKNVILNHMFRIMGKNYDSVSNANSILGSFNGILEGKTLLNFDEVTYGGNHSVNNQLKALISEDYVHINKKNKEAYRIKSMADFIITTNEDYFIGVSGDSRRYCPMALNQKWVGIQTEESRVYFNTIMDVPSECFAKFLYERDISDFNPRSFKKTQLFQQQVERSWTSTTRWLYQALESGHIITCGASKVIHWNKLPPKDSSSQSDFQWETYGSQSFTGDLSSFRKIAFLHNGVRWYRVGKLYEIYSMSKMGSYSKVVTEQVFRSEMTTIFANMKTKSHPKLGMCCQLPELDDGRKSFNLWSKWDYNWGGSVGCFNDDDEDDIVFTEEWDVDEEKDKKLYEKHKDSY